VLFPYSTSNRFNLTLSSDVIFHNALLKQYVIDVTDIQTKKREIPFRFFAENPFSLFLFFFFSFSFFFLDLFL